jgi:hypothetical protein
MRAVKAGFKEGRGVPGREPITDYLGFMFFNF